MTTLTITLRSLAFHIGYLLATAWIGLTAPFFFWLPYNSISKYILCWNRFTLWWLKVCCNIHIEVRGAENIPTSPVVYLSNHQSALETYFLQLYFRPVATILKRELLHIPGFGWGLRLMKPIAIDRASPREAIRQMMRQGHERLAEGLSLLIFPEGSRKVPGTQHKFARGGAGIAVNAGVDVIPVAHNAGVYCPKDEWLRKPGTIVVVIGKPITTTDKTPAEVTELAQNWVYTVLNSI